MADTIFISYRSDDSINIVNRLHDRIAETLGQKNIFMDVSAHSAASSWRILAGGMLF